MTRPAAPRALFRLGACVSGMVVALAGAAAAEQPAAGPARDRAALAADHAAKGELKTALTIWRELAASDVRAVGSVTRAARAIGELEGEQSAFAYCRSFVDKRRGVQALACGRAVPALQTPAPAPERADFQQFWIDAVAALAAPTLEDLRDILAVRPDLAPEFDSVGGCQRGFRPMERAHWPDALDPNFRGSRLATDDLYARLSESAEPPLSRCLLSVAASRCLLRLIEARQCRAPRTLARFAESLATDDPRHVSTFLEILFEGKGALYGNLREPRVRPGTELSLFHLHLALAYVYTKLDGRFSTSKLSPEVQTPSFHVGRARFFWEKMHPGTPLPVAYLEGVKVSGGPR